MTAYNGHRSWNAWNVALWIANDEPTYLEAIFPNAAFKDAKRY